MAYLSLLHTLGGSVVVVVVVVVVVDGGDGVGVVGRGGSVVLTVVGVFT